MVKWMAVLYGIVAAFIVGLISGLGLPFTDATLPVIGQGLTGFIAGGVAGYMAYQGVGGGALHGFLATTIGGLIVSLVLVLLGTITAGTFGLGVALVVLTLIVVSGIPGAIGGALGGMYAANRRPEEEEEGRPVA
jgi:hypothetical protein